MNRAEQKPIAVRCMARLLERARARASASEPAELDADTEAQLRAMGYIH